MRVLILGFQNRTGVPEAVRQIRPAIERHVQIVQEDLTGRADLSEVEADLALVFGGDGSILRAVQQMGPHQIPLLAVNLGRLGFLAELSRDDDLISVLEQLSGLESTEGTGWLEALRKGTHAGFSISSHRLLECTVRQNVGTPHETRVSSLVMNETAIQSAAFHIIELCLRADEECVTTCRCDGIILSTPIGSTAHNLSVGGPILHPGLEAVVISPIAPHTLTFRPIIDSSLRVYTIQLTSAGTAAAVMADGRQIAEITPADCVEVTPSNLMFQMLNVPDFSYYRRLQKKLGWGGHLG